jgi:hypothetical protein
MTQAELLSNLKYLHKRFDHLRKEIIKDESKTARNEYAVVFNDLARLMGEAVKEGHVPCDVCSIPVSQDCTACGGTGLKS